LIGEKKGDFRHALSLARNARDTSRRGVIGKKKNCISEKEKVVRAWRA
jgi:hypothetical protein